MTRVPVLLLPTRKQLPIAFDLLEAVSACPWASLYFFTLVEFYSLSSLRHVVLHILSFSLLSGCLDPPVGAVRGIAHRQEQGASDGAINWELANLKRAFNLALRAEKITRKPYIPLLEENSTRQGFFEQAEYEAVLAKLPDHLRPVITFAYYTGWRIRSEVLSLTWQQVDFDSGTVRLDPGTTKNKEGRVIYMTRELRALLENQWQEHLAHYPDCPLVFHDHGKQVFTFYKAWYKACWEAGLSGKIPHDFRRTAVRNMVRASIPERVAMQMSGHKTRSIFDRYHIVSDQDLREAARRLDTALTPQTTTLSTTHPLLTEEERPLIH